MTRDTYQSHTQDSKTVLDISWLDTWLYMVRIKGKVEQYKKSSCALPYFGVVAIEKVTFESPYGRQLYLH